jgi:hypothetical protein
MRRAARAGRAGKQGALRRDERGVLATLGRASIAALVQLLTASAPAVVRGTSAGARPPARRHGCLSRVQRPRLRTAPRPVRACSPQADGRRPRMAGSRRLERRMVGRGDGAGVARAQGGSGPAAARHGPARRCGHGPPRAARAQPAPGVGARPPGGGARVRGPSRHGLGRGSRVGEMRRSAGSAGGGVARAPVGARVPHGTVAAAGRRRREGERAASAGRSGGCSRPGRRWQRARGAVAAPGGKSLPGAAAAQMVAAAVGGEPTAAAGWERGGKKPKTLV